MSDILQINTPLVYDNLVMQKERAIEALLVQNFPDFQIYRGHRPIAREDVSFPCFMIEPTSAKQEMDTTDVTAVSYVYDIFFYIKDGGRDGLVDLQGATMEALQKLFSNNALNDMQLPAKSNKYKRYDGFWIDSEMRALQKSPTFKFDGADGEKFCRAGRLTLEVFDRLIR